MKKEIISIAVATVTGMSMVTNALAKSVNVTGIISGSEAAFTVMVTKSGADLYNLDYTDIVYMNQAEVAQDGSFSLKMPLLDGAFETHTNIDTYDVADVPQKTVYLSTGGNDSFDGLSIDKPKKTFNSIYNILDEVSDIVILSDITLSLPSASYNGTISIKGKTGQEKLSVSGISQKGNLKLDNLVFNGTNSGDVSCYIFANGYTLEMGENLTSKGRLTVYGGKNGEEVQTTDLKLYGGQYRGIYGGGYNGAVTEDTNVIVGGNVNPYDGVDDSNSSTLSPTYVYGGAYNASVGGKTNVTITGNATVNSVVGAGNGALGTATDTNIYVKGGNIMGLCGGGLQGGPELVNCNTHITMTGGMVEGIFGGCGEKSMSGSSYIKLMGGEVTRRVYSGCYTDGSSAKYISGTTVIEIYPNASLCTGNGLSWLNKLDMGVYAGSRSGQTSAEKNFIIYSDDCYSAKKSAVKRDAAYVLNVGKGGSIELNAAASKVKGVPQMGRGVIINNTRAGVADTSLVSGVNTIKFDGITTASASKNQSGVEGNINVSLGESCVILATVYDMSNNSIKGVQKVNCSTSDKEIDLNIDCSLEQGKQYVVQLFLWDSMDNIKPLACKYIINLE